MATFDLHFRWTYIFFQQNYVLMKYLKNNIHVHVQHVYLYHAILYYTTCMYVYLLRLTVRVCASLPKTPSGHIHYMLFLWSLPTINMHLPGILSV